MWIWCGVVGIVGLVVGRGVGDRFFIGVVGVVFIVVDGLFERFDSEGVALGVGGEVSSWYVISVRKCLNFVVSVRIGGRVG